MIFFTSRKWIGLSLIIFLISLQTSTAQFVKGADISAQTEMQSKGRGGWLDDNGNSKSLHEILKDHSMKAIRLRVWVDPANGWSNTADVVKKAKWAKSAKMDVMIDFHYSHTFADPKKQKTPKKWKNYNVKQMNDAIWNHTRSVLTAIKKARITPKWVQIGNETGDGMLWPLGKASTNGFKNYAQFVTTGNNAAKSIFKKIKTIVHIENGQNRTDLKWTLDGLKKEGAKYDIIGLSLYPDANWGLKVNPYLANITYLSKRYKKKTMLCEVGMNAAPVQTAYDALYKIINESKKKGSLGVFYWEPQGYNNFRGYTKHAWQSNKRPTFALDAFIYAARKEVSLNEKTIVDSNNIISYLSSPDVLNIKWDADYSSSGVIYSIDGSKASRFDLNSGSNEVDISLLSSGIYIISIEGSTKKFVKN